MGAPCRRSPLTWAVTWHTVNGAVVAYGRRLVDDQERIGTVSAIGLDETLFGRRGRWRHKRWSTSIVDVREGRLLGVMEGRDAMPAVRSLAARSTAWRAQIRYATLDLSGAYRSVFDTLFPHAVQVADPFHLIRVRHEALCYRGRVRDPTRRPVAAGR